MKIKNILITLVSAIALLFSSSVVSFAKVVGDKIILGAAISLTGKYSSNGVHTQNGYNMAVDRINSMGGVKVGGKTYKFDIIYYDDESNPKRAAQLAERLISQDKVEFMLGPYSSGLTKAIAPVTEKYGVPMVEANGASRSLFTKGYKYLFAASKIPNLTSCEKASCSNACAILTGFPLFFSTAKSIATSRYKFAGANTANRYL